MMKTELQAIKDAWETKPRDDDAVRAMADAYVAAYPEEFEGLEAQSLDDHVRAIDTFREAGAGYEEDVQRLETWLLHRFAPQNIGGTYQPQIRVTGGSE